ncbi:MAG: (Fe-S)-binding protein [Chloroflexota bacterium]|nr:(Fe-S)-binding protein [Chloroflexota bacterium]MBI5703438.1 (Fe-S)-binding protein [Chloroflexota bacterium]
MTTVQLFVTCLIDSFYPKTGEAVVNILHRLGIDVDFPRDQTCCGQPNFNAGLWAEARPIAEHTIRVLERPPKSSKTSEVCDIVIPSGSCAHMLKHGYLELFADDPVWLPRAQALAGRVYEFTEYLVDKLGVTDLGARWDGLLTYHPSCHTLRGMNIDRQPRALLANVRGATVIELPHAEECCGFGGIFSMEHPELSAEWLKRKIVNLEATQAPTLVVADSGCRMHIAGGLHRQKKPQRVVHIAEVLAGQ